MRKLVGLIAGAMAFAQYGNDALHYRSSKGSARWVKSNLTKAQKKRRNKAKASKKARKKQRN